VGSIPGHVSNFSTLECRKKSTRGVALICRDHRQDSKAMTVLL